MQPEKTITSREIIKPSSPTPTHLRIYKLSLLDQLNPRIYIPIVFFYPNSGTDSLLFEKAANISHRLKNSLSKILTKYYPLAGRIKDDVSVECNDEGVDYFETCFKCSLFEILQQPTAETPSLFFSNDLPWNDMGKLDSLLVVEVSFFDCGGVAIAACMPHKIVDACSVTNFMSDWGTAMRQSDYEASPEFVAASIFPPSDLFALPETQVERGNCVARRYTFKATKLAELKAMAAKSGVKNPSRVEVVTALLYKCAMAASSRANLYTPKPNVLLQTAHLRPKTVPPLPENSIGNIVSSFPILTMENQKKDLPSLICQLREAKLEFFNKHAKNLKGEEWFALICDTLKEVKNIFKGSNSPYMCSSWCKFPLYQVDFGFGKAVWVSTARSRFKNGLFMMDTRSGEGVEAWVNLEECDMAVFERDEELVAFATLNSSVLDFDEL